MLTAVRKLYLSAGPGLWPTGTLLRPPAEDTKARTTLEGRLNLSSLRPNLGAGELDQPHASEHALRRHRPIHCVGACVPSVTHSAAPQVSSHHFQHMS